MRYHNKKRAFLDCISKFVPSEGSILRYFDSNLPCVMPASLALFIYFQLAFAEDTRECEVVSYAQKC